MAQFTVIAAPYHAGQRGVRVGRGPTRLIELDLIGRITANGASAQLVEIAPVDEFEGEIGRSFEIIRRIARAVDAAIQAGSFPLVLAGNCNASVGVLAGLPKPEAVVWYDAHGDYDTPDETLSGYFDGMGVSMLAGESWAGLVRTVPGHAPFDLAGLTYCAVRDLSDAQRAKILSSPATAVFAGEAISDADLLTALDDALCRHGRCRSLLHLDVDCLDTSVGLANEYAAPGGLRADTLASAVRIACRHTEVAAMTVASFNPDLEGGDRIAAAAIDAVLAVVGAVSLHARG